MVMPSFTAGAWSYHVEYRRCPPGKCKTCDVGGRHGPYRYAVRREGKRIVKRYIGKQAMLPGFGADGQ